MTKLLDPFLLGVVATEASIAALCFARFWQQTRDELFLAFAASFFIDAVTRVIQLVAAHPNEGPPTIHIARLAGFTFIAVSIVRKNSKRGR